MKVENNYNVCVVPTSYRYHKKRPAAYTTDLIIFRYESLLYLFSKCISDLCQQNLIGCWSWIWSSAHVLDLSFTH